MTLLVCMSLSASHCAEGKEKAYGGKTYTEARRKPKHVIHIPPFLFLSSPSLLKSTLKGLQSEELLESSSKYAKGLRRLSILEKVNPVNVFSRQRKYDYTQNAMSRSEEITRALSSEDLSLFGLSA